MDHTTVSDTKDKMNTELVVSEQVNLRDEISCLIKRTNLEPRPYQERIVRKIIKNYTDSFHNPELPPIKSQLVESPVGSGKTAMALLATKYIQEKMSVMLNRPFNIGWVAMRKNLLSQAERENARHGVNVKLEYISMFEKNLPTNLDMLVVDEAQHDAASSMAHIHNTIKPKWILGLSGTPFRSDRIKLCFDKTIKDAGIGTLIKEGYLSEYDHYTIPVFSPIDICDFYMRDKKRWGKSLMFFHTVQQCYEAMNILQSHKVNCAVVTGQSDKEQQILDFVENRTQVLINCMVLTEGFDCPDINTIFCKPSCKGLTIQMCGRGFRKCPTVRYKNIVQCKRTKWPFPKTAMPHAQHVWQSNEWRSLYPNDRVKHAYNTVIGALAHIEVTMPSFITNKKKLTTRRGFRDRRVS